MIKFRWLLLIMPSVLLPNIFSTLAEFNQHNRAQAYAAFNYFIRGQKAAASPSQSMPMASNKRFAAATLHEMHGLPKPIQDRLPHFNALRANEEHTIPLPRAFIFFGPSGTGKTTAAYAIARQLGFESTQVFGAQFFNQYIGESQRNVEKLFEQLRALQKKVMLIVEDIDALIGQRVIKEHPEYRAAADRFIAELSMQCNENIYVIGTTKNISEVSAVLKHNGNLEQEFVEFALPSGPERDKIVRAGLARMHYQPSNELAQSLVEHTHYLSPQDIALVLSKINAADLNQSGDAIIEAFERKRREKNEEAQRAAAESEPFFAPPVEPRITFNDLGGTMPVEIAHLLQKFTAPQSCIQIRGADDAGGLLLYGPPGTGKTSLGEAFAGQARAKFVYVAATSINDGTIGSGARHVESIFRQVKQYIERNPTDRVVLFIDEIDAVGTRQQGDHAEYGNTLNALKIALSDIAKNKSVFVIAATNHKGLLDPALIRSGRFNTQLLIPLPHHENRALILRHYLNKVPHTIAAQDLDAYVDRLAQQTDGFNCADLQSIILDKACTLANVAHEAAISQMHIDQGLMAVRKGHFDRLKDEMPYRMEHDPSLGLENILGIPNQVMNHLADLKTYARSRNQAPRGLLLYGPPGTGKTTLAKAIAQASGFDAAFIVAPQLFNFAEGSAAVSKLFEQLRSTQRPTVLIVDEVDKIGSKHAIETVPGASSVATMFWNELSNPLNHMIFVIATTNKPEQLEEALVRTGRFDTKVSIDLPDNNVRGQIIDFYLRQHGLEIGVEPLNELVKLTKNYSGQDIKTFIMGARRECKRGEEQTAMMKNLRAIIEADRKARIEQARRLLKENAPFTISEPTKSIKDIAGKIDADILTLMQDFKAGHTNFNRTVPQGLLLHGPPGTGKTLLAEVFASQAQARFISISAGSFAQKYVGEGPQMIKSMFALAKSYAEEGGKIVIFIDEFEAVAVQRRNNDNREDIRMVGELLVGLAAVNDMSDKIFIIAATNCEKDLEEAIIRSGRFNTIKKIDLPALPDRAALLKHYLDPWRAFHNLYPPNATAEQLAQSPIWKIATDTKDFAQSDLQALVDVAFQIASKEKSKTLEVNHLSAAVKEVHNVILQRKDRNKNMQEKQLDESIRSRQQGEEQFNKSQGKGRAQYIGGAMLSGAIQGASMGGGWGAAAGAAAGVIISGVSWAFG